ncbi:Protein roadkill [Folsomia candida]|uniref:Protein roadkill n=1 Tax=Folsomia candida TaxID=158441 RepID=A0A226DEY2_FOLCA|nr:Protein roadkill [Folsomia candida]
MQWDIEDFKILLGLEDGLERIRLPFEFGPETGIKSRWEFFFCKDSRGWMGFWLKMLKFEETNINVEVSGRLESQGAIELAQRDSDIEFADSTPETYFSHGTFRSANLTHVVFPNMAKGLKCSYICPTNLHSILTEGTLALRLKFTVFLNKFVDTVKEPACAGIKAKSVCRLNQQNLMLAMFLEGIGSDVTILTRDDQHVKAHKCILSASSSVFRAMFSTQMSEKEAGMVEMSDIGSQALNVFLRFCYTGEIEDNWGEFYAELIYAADKV